MKQTLQTGFYFFLFPLCHMTFRARTQTWHRLKLGARRRVDKNLGNHNTKKHSSLHFHLFNKCTQPGKTNFHSVTFFPNTSIVRPPHKYSSWKGVSTEVYSVAQKTEWRTGQEPRALFSQWLGQAPRRRQNALPPDPTQQNIGLLGSNEPQWPHSFR